jgi:hypothetical protein
MMDSEKLAISSKTSRFGTTYCLIMKSLLFIVTRLKTLRNLFCWMNSVSCVCVALLVIFAG